MTLDNLDQTANIVASIPGNIANVTGSSRTQATSNAYDERFKQKSPVIYRKRNTVTAEQFDDSRKMIAKYNLLSRRWSAIKMLKTPHGRVPVINGDWIVTDHNGDYHLYTEDSFHKEYEAVGWQ